MWIACGNRYHVVALGILHNSKRLVGVCGARSISRFARDNKPRKGIACQRCLKIIESHEERKKKVKADQWMIYGK